MRAVSSRTMGYEYGHDLYYGNGYVLAKCDMNEFVGVLWKWCAIMSMNVLMKR